MEKRRLGGFERFFIESHKLGFGLIYMITEIKSNPTASSLIEDIDDSTMIHSMHIITKRYPILRSVIVRDEYLQIVDFNQFIERSSRNIFKYTLDISNYANIYDYVSQLITKSPIPFHVQEHEGGSWIHPLWRLSLIKDEAQNINYFLLIAHHSIMDANSMLTFLSEYTSLLSILNRLKNSNDSITNKLCVPSNNLFNFLLMNTLTLPTEQSIDDYLHKEFNLLKTFYYLCKKVKDAFYGKLRDGLQILLFMFFYCFWSENGNAEQTKVYDFSGAMQCKGEVMLAGPFQPNWRKNRSCSIITASISPDILNILKNETRNQNVTITAALVASLILKLDSINWSNNFQNCCTFYTIETMCNLRPFIHLNNKNIALLSAPIDFGLFGVWKKTTPSNTRSTIYDPNNLWSLAKNYKAQLTNALNKRIYIRELELFRLFVWIKCIFWSILKVFTRLPFKHAGRVKTASVSNLGVIDKKLDLVNIFNFFDMNPQANETFNFILSQNRLAIPLHGDYSLGQTNFGITGQGLGHCIFLSAATRNEFLHVTLTSTQPILQARHAHDILDGLVHELESVALSDATKSIPPSGGPRAF